jgi:hypothetical protein
MSGLLDQLMNGLKGAQKTLPQAAREVAVGPLQIVGVSANCKPGVLSGFAGGYTDVPVQVPAPAPAPVNPGNPGDAGDGGGGAGDGGSAGGGEGAGAGASLGQFLNTIVRAERSDGTLIGQAVTDKAKGMVTVITCGYQGPVHISMQAKPDGTSQYYEESTGKYAAYPAGEEMHAVVPMVNKNMGITLLTEAAWQYMLVKHGPDGWKSAANVTQANQFIGTEFNKFLPKDLQITDITRLPFLVSDTTKAGTLTTSPNDVYGLVSSGLARAAGLMRAGDLAPALKLVRQLGKDLCDGVIDLTCNGVPVVADSKDAAYLPPQFAETLNRGIGDVAAACGNAASNDAGFRVTQIVMGITAQFGSKGAYWVGTYSDQQPMYLLRSDGQAFYWQNRQSKPEAFLPQYSFSKLFAPIDANMVALTQDGTFLSQKTSGGSSVVTTFPEFFGATATQRSSLGGAPGRAQISRLPSGRAVYFPHYNDGDASWTASTKESMLGDITSVAIGYDARGGGFGPSDPPQNLTDEPTFYVSTARGEAYAWGNDRYGALGDGKSQKETASLGSGAPQKVIGVGHVVSVVGRRAGAFALDAKGGVWAWGDDSKQGLLFGKKIRGETIYSTSTPMAINDFEPFGPVAQMACGVARICTALTRSGKLLAWGIFGEESPSVPLERQIPLKHFGVTEVPLPIGRRVTYIDAIFDMIYAVMDDGTLVVFPNYPNAPDFIDPKRVFSDVNFGKKSVTCMTGKS